MHRSEARDYATINGQFAVIAGKMPRLAESVIRSHMVLLFSAFLILFAGCGRDSTLNRAVRDNDIAAVKSLLAKGNDVNERIGSGESPIIIAAEHAKPEMLETLLEDGADPHARDRNGYTPLLLAAGKGRTDNVMILLSAGAKVNETTPTGYTALMASADRGWTETAKLLIAGGAQIDAKTTAGYTALMSAVWSRDVETVQVLVDAGADLSLKNNKGETALTIAQGLDEKGMIAILRAKQVQKSQNTLESMKVSHHPPGNTP